MKPDDETSCNKLKQSDKHIQLLQIKLSQAEKQMICTFKTVAIGSISSALKQYSLYDADGDKLILSSQFNIVYFACFNNCKKYSEFWLFLLLWHTF